MDSAARGTVSAPSAARLRHALPALVALVLFAAALEVLRTELRSRARRRRRPDAWR
jgi:hypothetical protein